MVLSLGHVRAHPRLVIAAAAGVLVGCFMPGLSGALSRSLLGWNVGVWLYLASVAWLMFRVTPERLQAISHAQASSAFSVLMLATLAVAASVGAVVYEVSSAKATGSHPAALHLFYALATVAGSWLLLPTLFALNYASRFHGEPGGEGLQFPGTNDDDLPDYSDFLYFAFTIAVASQTADVAISTRSVRRLVLLQSLLSFAFNTTVLAFTVNIAASLF